MNGAGGLAGSCFEKEKIYNARTSAARCGSFEVMAYTEVAWFQEGERCNIFGRIVDAYGSERGWRFRCVFGGQI